MESKRLLQNSLRGSALIHLLLVAAILWNGIGGKKIGLMMERLAVDWVSLEPLTPPTKTKPIKNQNKVVRTLETHPTEHAVKDAFLSRQTQRVREQTVGRERAGTGTRNSALGNLGINYRPEQKFQDLERLSAEQLAQIGNPGEYLKGIPQGERTLLNTKEFVFFGYFERIRIRLDQAWDPILRKAVSKFYHQGRKLASDVDHSTRLYVVLDDQGEVTKVQILERSGTRDLDQAAVQAFQQAGPFPNPPQGLIEMDGTIKISWEFIVLL